MSRVKKEYGELWQFAIYFAGLASKGGEKKVATLGNIVEKKQIEVAMKELVQARKLLRIASTNGWKTASKIAERVTNASRNVRDLLNNDNRKLTNVVPDMDRKAEMSAADVFKDILQLRRTEGIEVSSKDGESLTLRIKCCFQIGRALNYDMGWFTLTITPSRGPNDPGAWVQWSQPEEDRGPDSPPLTIALDGNTPGRTQHPHIREFTTCWGNVYSSMCNAALNGRLLEMVDQLTILLNKPIDHHYWPLNAKIKVLSRLSNAGLLNASHTVCPRCKLKQPGRVRRVLSSKFHDAPEWARQAFDAARRRPGYYGVVLEPDAEDTVPEWLVKTKDGELGCYSCVARCERCYGRFGTPYIGADGRTVEGHLKPGAYWVCKDGCKKSRQITDAEDKKRAEKRAARRKKLKEATPNVEDTNKPTRKAELSEAERRSQAARKGWETRRRRQQTEVGQPRQAH